jgi:uncharacterized protein (TIGR02996 family)
MSTETALLSAIRQNPEEDAARLVYADYLDEQGGAANAARAEFVRLQVRLAGTDEADRERDALEDRENELLRKYERTWLGPLSGPLATGLTEWRFERGFVAKIRTDSKTLRDHGTALFACHPIGRLRVGMSEPDDPGPVKKLAKCAWWGRVRDLGLDDFSALSVLACEPLLLSPQLTAVRRLAITPTDDSEDASDLLGALARCDWLSGLEELRMSGSLCGELELVPVLEASAVRRVRLSGGSFNLSSLAALLSADYGRRACRVELADGTLGAALWRALARKKVKPVLGRLSFTGVGRNVDLDLPTLLSAPAAGKLDALDLSETHLSGTRVRAVTTGGFLSRATELGLTRCSVNAKVMAALAKIDAPRLGKLKLGETGLRNAGAFALCTAAWADTLTDLDLMRNYLDDEALVAMARSGRFVNLRRLDLRVNSPDLAGDCKGAIGDTGVIALASAPNFARMRHLNLYRTRVTVKGVDAILHSPHWRITELELGGYDLGAELVDVLAKSPRLARLTKLGLSFTPSLGGNALLPLAESPHLSPLCHLDIRYNNTSKRVRAKLVARLGRRLEDSPAVDSW